MIKLVCPECQRQNEPERIYCHDCGARLDRSALAKVAPKVEEPEETHRRLKRMLDPSRAKIKALFFKISKLLLGSCALAVLVQMLVPPNVPERSKSPELLQINLDLESTAMNRGGAPLQYTEAQINDYFLGLFKSKRAALSSLLQFERVFVNFDENVCRVTAERSLFGFSFFITTSHTVALQSGTLSASNNGGNIGRMPVHPMLMKFGDFLFADLWQALDREKKLVAKMGAIEFHPQKVVLIPKQ
jgi:hypothetical protein